MGSNSNGRLIPHQIAAARTVQVPGVPRVILALPLDGFRLVHGNLHRIRSGCRRTEHHGCGARVFQGVIALRHSLLLALHLDDEIAVDGIGRHGVDTILFAQYDFLAR